MSGIRPSTTGFAILALLPDAKQPYLQQMDEISRSPFKPFKSPQITPTYQRPQDVEM